MKGYFRKGELVIGYDYSKENSETILTVGRFVDKDIVIDGVYSGKEAEEKCRELNL